MLKLHFLGNWRTGKSWTINDFEKMKELQILLEILPTEALTRILRVTCHISFLVKEHSVLAA